MATDYEPGTVAIATVRGIEGVRVVRCGGIDQQGFWWTPEFCGDILGNEPQWRMHADSYVTDIRPLVVLDPANLVPLKHGADHVRHQATYLRRLGEHGWGGLDPDLPAFLDHVADLMEPPRITEPGLWGVVEAHSPSLSMRRWVRHPGGSTNWRDAFGNSVVWDVLIDPVLIREGVES